MFASHLRFAEVAGRMIVLDIAEDRYRRLAVDLGALVTASQQRSLDSVEAATLRAADLLDPDGHGRTFAPLAVSQASREALQGSLPSPNLAIAGKALSALAAARVSLAARGLAMTLKRAGRRVQSTARVDDKGAATLAKHFEAARQWFPFERRCLPDGLALHRLLTGAGLRTTLVIGVRDTPFAAHCWVQAGDWLLTDTRDMIAELTPILAI